MSNLINIFKRLPHREAYSLAWPMILGNISVPLMGLADTAMLGHLPQSVFLGGVAIGATVIAAMYWMFSFLRMGTTMNAARAVGEKDDALLIAVLLQNLLIAFTLGLLVVVGQFVTIPLALWLIEPDAALMKVIAEYSQIRIYSAPAVLVTYVITGWFIGLQNTRVILMIMLIVNVLNIALDYLFIVHWNMEARGAAFASLAAEYVGLTVAVCWALHRLKRLGVNQLWSQALSRFHSWGKAFSTNTDLFFRTCALLFVFNFFNAVSAGFGHDTLAANAILLQLLLFVSFCLDGYAHAAEAMIAKALGAMNIRAFYEASTVIAVMAVLIALLLTVFLLAGAHVIFPRLSDIEEVVRITHQYSLWLFVLPMVSVWCYLFDGIFIGAGKTRTMMVSMLFALFLVFIPTWWFSRSWGNHGLWLAFILFNAARGVTLAWAFWGISRRKGWLLSI
ncbi:MAG: MATE family efflux transporter [Alteromonadaceae bacterium]|nr:MAG: MATE family efflux transporter [Alteromonadaceae bacterium]